jgi:hypothetical protein
MTHLIKQKRGKNWEEQELLHLIEAINFVKRIDIGEDGESSAALNSRQFRKFIEIHGSTSERTLKSVTDKAADLKDFFKWVVDWNATRVIGSTGRGKWFELDSTEKKNILKTNRKTGCNYSESIFEALKPIHDDCPDIDPDFILQVGTSPLEISGREEYTENLQDINHHDQPTTSNPAASHSSPPCTPSMEHHYGKRKKSRKSDTESSNIAEIIRSAEKKRAKIYVEQQELNRQSQQQCMRDFMEMFRDMHSQSKRSNEGNENSESE